jgi:hypothetical protein
MTTCQTIFSRFALWCCVVLIAFFGCSKHDNSPITPIAYPDDSQSSVQVMMSGSLNLDTGQIVSDNRDLESYLNVTGIVGGNFSFTIDEFIPPDTVKITLSLKNASSLTVNDVCIVFENLYGKTVLNPDCYIDIFQLWDIDPLIAFRKEDPYRAFPPLTDKEQLLLKYPGGSPMVDFFIIAHLGGNTGGVYDIGDCYVDGEITDTGGSATLGVDIRDWQFDTTLVAADTSALTGGITLFQQAGFPNPWTATITNSVHAPVGIYNILMMAQSNASPQYHTFNYFKIEVLPSGNGLTHFGTDIPIPGWDILPDINIVFTDSRSMTADGNNFYLAFCNMDSFMSGYMLFTSSTDGGLTWSPAIPITDTTATNAINPSIAVGSGSIYIAYHDSGLDSKVKFLKSSNNGSTWQTVNPSGLPFGSYFPSLCIKKGLADDTLYLAYIYNESDAGHIWVGRALSTNLNSWDSVQVNDNAVSGASLYSPCIAFDPNYYTIMLAWENEIIDTAEYSLPFFDICHTWPAWGTDVHIGTGGSNGDKCWEPRIAINPVTGIPGMIFRASPASVYKDSLRFTMATDRFATAFLPSIIISDNQSIWVSHHSASIACDQNGRWMVAFCREEDYGNPLDCFFDESYDGITWGTDQRIGDIIDQSAFTPVMASSGRRVCIAWSDERSGNFEMYVDRGIH